MRGVVEDLRSAVPLAPRLPAVLQEDSFLQRFLLAFDHSLAPVFVTLDGLTAYFDPRLAPEDFVDLLGEWVGVRLDDQWTLAQRREVIIHAAAIHAKRGTLAGVTEALRLAVGSADTVSVSDNGGAAWSSTPGATLPGSPRPSLHVTVSAVDPSRLDARRLDAVITAVKPAHIPHTLEIVGLGDPASAP